MTWDFTEPISVAPTSDRHRRQMEVTVFDADIDHENKTVLEIVIGIFWQNQDEITNYPPDERWRRDYTPNKFYIRSKYRPRGGEWTGYSMWSTSRVNASNGQLWSPIVDRIANIANRSVTQVTYINSQGERAVSHGGYFSDYIDRLHGYIPPHSDDGFDATWWVSMDDETPGRFSEVMDLPVCDWIGHAAASRSDACMSRFTGDEHPVCAYPAGCETQLQHIPPSNWLTGRSALADTLCAQHQSDLVQCNRCYNSVFSDDIQQATDGFLGLFDQPPSVNLEMCAHCFDAIEDMVSNGEYTCRRSDCNSVAWSVTDSDRVYCRECEIEFPNWRVNSYSWKPEPQFHPELPDDPRTLYHGFEFEVARLPHREACRWAEEVKLPASLFYFKSDSSVDSGTEVVTHPFTFEWAIKEGNFPFDKMQRAVDEFGALETHSSAGTHIHVSKSSFSRAHMWKFLQLHFRIPAFLQKAGGRDSTNYARWEHQALRLDAKRVAMKEQVGHGRLAVNVAPTHTVELRYPASGFSAYLARKNVELPNALYQFTEEITVQNVKDGIIDNPSYLLWWLNEEKEQFPTLLDYITRSYPAPTPFERRN